jgi:hypothetical protein
MSRWVDYHGRIVPRSLVEPWDAKPGDCPRCGGTGELVESYDPERYDGVISCYWCREFCKACQRHVKKAAFGGHECKPADDGEARRVRAGGWNTACPGWAGRRLVQRVLGRSDPTRHGAAGSWRGWRSLVSRGVAGRGVAGSGKFGYGWFGLVRHALLDGARFRHGWQCK